MLDGGRRTSTNCKSRTILWYWVSVIIVLDSTQLVTRDCHQQPRTSDLGLDARPSYLHHSCSSGNRRGCSPMTNKYLKYRVA